MNSIANIKKQDGQFIGVNLTLFAEVWQGFKPLAGFRFKLTTNGGVCLALQIDYDECEISNI
jgi:hypothetical protein